MGINELRVAVTLVSLAVFLGIVAWAWHGRFDDAEARAQMAARLRDGVNGFGAHIICELAQRRFRQGAHC